MPAPKIHLFQLTSIRKTEIEIRTCEKEPTQEIQAHRDLNHEVRTNTSQRTWHDQVNVKNKHQWYLRGRGWFDSYSHQWKTLIKINQSVKLSDLSDATIDDLKHHSFQKKKEADNIILHIGINHAAYKTSRQVLDYLLQLKNFISNIIHNCEVLGA